MRSRTRNNFAMALRHQYKVQMAFAAIWLRKGLVWKQVALAQLPLVDANNNRVANGSKMAANWTMGKPHPKIGVHILRGLRGHQRRWIIIL